MADLRNLTFAINIKGNEDKVVKTDRAIDDLVKTTGKSTKELEKTSKGIENIGSSKNLDGVKKGKRGIEDITKSLDSTQTKLKNVSGDMKKFGGNLNKFVTLPLAGVGIAAVKMNQDLKKDLATISTLIPGQSERLGELRKDIQRISIDVAKGTDEIADATYGVISAYGDAEDTMDKVALNAKAATAGVASTSDALNLSSAVMKGYGDTSAEANEKVLDLAFGTLKLGQTDFSSLASSIGQVVPLATELGIAQEDLFGVYAAATGVTGNASEVSTQYRGVLQSLMAPTKEMEVLISRMGYTNGRAMIEGEGLGGAIQSIVDTSKESGKPLKDYIGSIQGQTLALALAGSLSEDYKIKTEQLMDSSGMMTNAFKEQTEGVNASGFSYAQSMQRMKVASQELGEAASPMISTLADGFALISQKLVEIEPETLQMITKIGLIALALGPTIKLGGVVIGGIVKVIGAVGTVTAFLGKAGFAISAVAGGAATLGEGMLLIMGPIGWVVLALVALVAAGVAVYKNWDKLSEWGKKWWSEQKEGWEKAKNNTIQAWKGIQDGVSNAIGKIKELWEGLKTFFKNPIKGSIDIAQRGGNWIKDKFTGGKSVDGSNRDGLNKVPFNGYVSELHQDEMVLTKATSDRFRAMGGTKDNVPSVGKTVNSSNSSIINNSNITNNKSLSNISNKTSEVINNISRNISESLSNITNNNKTESISSTYNNYSEKERTIERIESRKEEPKILFNPVYNIEISGTATNEDKQEIEKVIDRKTRELFNIFFKEMNMKLA